jgi:hypothetical protein
MKKLLFVALSAIMCAPPVMADGIYREGVAPFVLCRDGSTVSVYNYMDPRYVCALRSRAGAEYVARVEQMRIHDIERRKANLRAIDFNARKNGY